MLPEGSKKHHILAVVHEMLTQAFSHTKTDSYARLFAISSPGALPSVKKCNRNCNQIGRFSP